MRIANNVVVHNPETNLGKIDADRLRSHGWPDEVVQQQREQSSHDAATPAPLPVTSSD
ncbi:hypothetical protein [Bradyrhizobium sp. MOS002]|uniref:hypothetical protein n=1 Tax=Bradyrhizobium sp. MOS002 TaxID=2133947 RepID=UPI001304DE06|nr:hypothetical protein [Bradyrhizobium sp. MOS002]